MKKLRILLVHNRYQQRGGEDSVVEEEIRLLEGHGHSIELLERNNAELDTIAPPRALLDTLWSRRTQREFATIADRFRPDIIHCHNTFPLISPSIYWAASATTAHPVPVVQTLHNFRLFCPQGMMLRDSQICNSCVGRFPWPAIRHACYRTSHTQTAALSMMLGLHRLLGTFRNKVDAYIALNDFCKEIFIQGGLPASKLYVKPNFLDTRSVAPTPLAGRTGNPLFVGRLSTEKGTRVLAAAAQLLELTIDVVGDGPERTTLQSIPNLRLLGAASQSQVYARMARAPFLIFPSIWYENFPRTIVEAFAHGLPVVGTNLGALPTIIRHKHTGLLFEPYNPDALSGAIKKLAENPELLASLSKNARTEYLQKYTPEANYSILADIYERVLMQ